MRGSNHYKTSTKLTACAFSALVSTAMGALGYWCVEHRRGVMVEPVSRAELEKQIANDPRAALYQLSSNQEIFFEHRANATVRFPEASTFEGVAAAWTVTTDRNGLRNNEPRVVADSRKLIMLGDSTTFGVGLSDEQTIPSRLSVELTHRLGRRVDCLNFGVGSYTTVQEVAYFKHKQAMNYDPEAIILGFCVNDFATGIGSIGVVAGQVQLLQPRLARKLKLGRTKVVNTSQPNPRTWSQVPPSRKTVRAVYAAIDMLRAEVGSTPLVVVVFPRSYQLNASHMEDVNRRQRLIRDYCERNKIACIDLLEHFHGTDPLEFYRVGDGIHPNEYAAERIARIVAGIIVDIISVSSAQASNGSPPG